MAGVYQLPCGSADWTINAVLSLSAYRVITGHTHYSLFTHYSLTIHSLSTHYPLTLVLASRRMPDLTFVGTFPGVVSADPTPPLHFPTTRDHSCVSRYVSWDREYRAFEFHVPKLDDATHARASMALCHH